MWKLIAGAAAIAGYVLGTRAGRERYEQMASASKKVWRDPRVQSSRNKAAETVQSSAHKAADTVKAKLPGGGTSEIDMPSPGSSTPATVGAGAPTMGLPPTMLPK